MYLHGSEQVQRASHTMAGAAERFGSAVSSFECHTERLERVLADFLQRLEMVLEEDREKRRKE